jgi:hypothetical protein
MIATGQIKATNAYDAETLAAQARLLKAAFHATRAVLTDARFLSHRGLTGGLWSLIRIFGRVRFKRVTLPFPAKAQLPTPEKRDSLNALLGRLDCKPVTTRFSVFVPSRIDYHWKGQDRIMQALAMTQASRNFTFIFAGWGADYHDFVARFGDLPNVRVLGFGVSKPLISSLCQASDMVIDQFTFGQIGSAAREAAAAGAPVMAWVERSLWARLFDHADMPILNARTPRQIARWLDLINEDKVSLSARGAAGRKWIEENAAAHMMGRILESCTIGRSSDRRGV